MSCTIWESRDVKKADLSVLDISSAIIARVESMPESMDYFYVGKLISIPLCMCLGERIPLGIFKRISCVLYGICRHVLTQLTRD